MSGEKGSERIRARVWTLALWKHFASDSTRIYAIKEARFARSHGRAPGPFFISGPD